MYGMDMMSSAVKPLAEVPEFTNLLLKFSNPLLGVIAGALLTAVIQSSSASVGILQALCLTGAVPFSAAIPIIMGQNIGTCITAILSAIGAKKNAKRAAAVHLYFNLIGTVIFMTVFYLINAVVGFSFFHQAATPAGIAVIHSVFNVTATIILLPFAKGLEKLACLTIRDKKRGCCCFSRGQRVYDPGASFPGETGICSRAEPQCSKKNGRRIPQCTVYSTESGG